MSQVRHDAPATTMTAVVTSEYGSADVLRVETVERPAPRDGEVLVRVHAASVCKGDIHLLNGKPYALRLMGFGLRRPRNPLVGQSFAGTVVESDSGDFRIGDAVYGQAGAGAFAEYVSVPIDAVAAKPPRLSFEQAAAVPDSALTALQGLRDAGGLRAGQAVLINGASGGVGTFAVQIAKALGAEVTAVCSTRHIEVVRTLGADHVIDYTAADFAREGRRYDVVLDLAGNRSLSAFRRILKSEGVFVSSAGAPGGNWFGPLLWMGKVLATGLFTAVNTKLLLMRPNAEDLRCLNELIEQGAIDPVVEQTFPLTETSAAVRSVERGHARGKTIITM